VLSLSLLFSLLHLNTLAGAFDALFIADFLPWFLIGIAFFVRERRNDVQLSGGLFLVGGLSLSARALLDHSYPELAAVVIVPALFVGAAHAPVMNRILSDKRITAVGAASYSLYLLHQNLGVAFMAWVSDSLHFRGPYSIVLALAAAMLVTLSAMAIYRYWETPLNRVLVAAVLSRKRERAVAPQLVGVTTQAQTMSRAGVGEGDAA
jgi:peptidoglycan/LPS O-acetylase OafA/YrhL